MKTIEIEMIHDIICSWCPIGYRNVVTAIRNLDGTLKDQGIEVSIKFLPYQLNPDMPMEGEKIEIYLKNRYGWTQTQLMDYRMNLIGVAEKAGLAYDFSRRTRYFNTDKAHRLIHWAETQGKHIELNELLITEYFTRGLDVSDERALLQVIDMLGLNAEDAIAALYSETLTKTLGDKYDRVKGFNISSVPSFVFNHDQCVSGSNSVEFFEQYLLTMIGKNESDDAFDKAS